MPFAPFRCRRVAKASSVVARPAGPSLFRPRRRRVEPIPAGGAETERLQDSFEISSGWTFGNRKVLMPCARSRESSCIKRAPPSSMKERSDTISAPSLSLHIKKVGLDSLVGGDGESCDARPSVR